VARPPTTRHLGLDLGGTNIKWAVLEFGGGATWSVLDRNSVPTLADEGPNAVIGRMASIGADAVSRWPDLSSVGIGVPGLYDPATGSTRFLVNLPGDWDGKPVASVVGDALGLPAHMINDARAFGLAELRLGAGRGVASMVGLVLGTGVGGVIAIDGRVHQGHDGTAGELGHQTIDPDGPMCGCGNRGCLESFVRAGQIAAACGAASAEEAVARARAGDEHARVGMAEVGRHLGIGIANTIVAVTPDRVVIGGGVSGALDLLLPAVWDELRQRVHVTSLESVQIVAAELGTWAGAIGAAVHGAEAAGQTVPTAR
jgi:glucokinase